MQKRKEYKMITVNNILLDIFTPDDPFEVAKENLFLGLYLLEKKLGFEEDGSSNAYAKEWIKWFDYAQSLGYGYDQAQLEAHRQLKEL